MYLTLFSPVMNMNFLQMNPFLLLSLYYKILAKIVQADVQTIEAFHDLVIFSHEVRYLFEISKVLQGYVHWCYAVYTIKSYHISVQDTYFKSVTYECMNFLFHKQFLRKYSSVLSFAF